MPNYSREASTTLPATAADLTTLYSPAEVAAVLTVDGNTVGQGGTEQYLIHEFKVDGSGKKTGIGTVTGRSTVACSDSTVYLQAYNNSSGWTTIDFDSSTAANSDFTLTYNFDALENYKDGSSIITLRVHQYAGALNLPQFFFNQNMESGDTTPDDWSSTGASCIFTWDTAQHHSGSRSLKIMGTGGSNDLGYWDTGLIPVSSFVGKKIRIGAWVKAQSGVSPSWYDGNPTCIQTTMTVYDQSQADNNRGHTTQSTYLKEFDWQYLPLFDHLVQDGDYYVRLEIGGQFINDSTSAIWFDDVRSDISDWDGIVRPTVLFRKDATANVWSENQCADIKKTDTVPGGSVPGSPVHEIVAVKGERQAFQVVVQPLDGDWDTITWTNDAWSGGFSPTVTVKRPLYLTIAAAASTSIIGRGGDIADPMPLATAEVATTVPQSFCTPYMIEIDIPTGAAAGTYTTNFYLKKSGTTMATIPVSLEVKNVALPTTPTFWQIGNMTRSRIMYYEDPNDDKTDQQKIDILKRYLDNFKVNRNSPGGSDTGLELYTDTWSPDLDPDGAPVLDTDPEADQLWAYMNSIGIAGWPPRGNWGEDGFTNYQALGYNFTPEFGTNWTIAATAQIEAIMARRDAQGCGAFNWDIIEENCEPDTVTAMATRFDFVKSVDSRIKIGGAGKPLPGITDHIDYVCCSDTQFLVWKDGLTALIANGGRAGVYPNGFTGTQAGTANVGLIPLVFRMYIWALWNAGYRSILHWTIGDWWDPFTQVEHNPWLCNFAGEPVFIYPPRSTSENGPVDSIRWSAQREGLEDVELFEMLRLLIISKTGIAPAGDIVMAQSLINSIESMATHWPVDVGGLVSDVFCNLNLTTIETIRINVIDSIETLQAY